MAIESIALESLKSKEKKERVKERLYVRVCEKKRENVQWKLHIRFVDVKMHKRDMNLYITCFRWLVYAFYFLPVTLHPAPSRISPRPIPFFSSRKFQIEARWWWNRRGDCHWPSSNLPHEIAARDRSQLLSYESNGVDRGWLVIDEGRFKMKYFFKRAVTRA